MDKQKLEDVTLAADHSSTTKAISSAWAMCTMTAGCREAEGLAAGGGTVRKTLVGI